MSNQVKKQQVKPLALFEQSLDSLLKKGIEAIPQNVNSDRLKINALMKISQDENLNKFAQSNAGQLAQIVYNFVTLGLDMLQNEAYIIPFGKTPTIIIDYKGELKLAKTYSVEPIKKIYSRVVFENDNYYFDGDIFVHNFDPFSLERGERIGAFCTIEYMNGTQHTEYVTTEDIKNVMAVSKTASRTDSVWNKWTDSMWQKTVIKKAMKTVSLDFGSNERQLAYKQSDTDIDFNRNKERRNDKEIEKVQSVVDTEFDYEDILEAEIVEGGE